MRVWTYQSSCLHLKPTAKKDTKPAMYKTKRNLESKSLGDANRTVEKSELKPVKMYNLGSRLEEMKAKYDKHRENKSEERLINFNLAL